MRKQRIVVSGILALVTSVIFSIIFSSNSFAIKAASIDTITNRAKIADLAKCHANFVDTVNIDNLENASDILNESSVQLALPNTVRNDTFGCAELLDNGLVTKFNASNVNSKANFLKTMGYNPVSSSSSSTESCKDYTIKFSDSATEIIDDSGMGSGVPEQVIKVCATIDNSKVKEVNIKETKGFSTSVGVIDESSHANRGIKILSCGGNRLGIDAPGISSGCDGATQSYDENNPNSVFTAVDTLLQQANDDNFTYSSKTGGGMSDGGSQKYLNTYKKGPLISNTSTIFTEDERIGLLVAYFNTYGQKSCNYGGKDEDGNESKEITINDQKYYIRKQSGSPDKFFVIDGTSWFKTVSWDEIVSAIDGQTIEGVQSCDGTDPPAMGDGTLLQEGSIEDGCFSGANSLGWIVCPIITALRETMDVIYQNVIEPFLQIDVTVFKTEGNSIYSGWQIFQGFANIAFVILLLVVVFSQVTGIGIDNLGIKRILPKLIVAAVLINLSYIICQLLVDISNISGYGLRSLFDSIPIQAPEAEAGESLVATLISGAIGGAAIGTAAATVTMWAPFVILPLLLGLISILISVLFMFILLGVRQAGVIILVVVSPLAFVFYMLPNTKPIFQRWWKALTGLLLLFPICGAMIGGSALAGRIIASTSNDFWPNLLAALITVVPFFFVPTLLKGSFSALGNIGAKISGVGNKIGGGLGKLAGEGVKRTGAFKNIQANAKDREELRSRVAERRRLEGITNRIGNISAGMRTPEQQLQYARAQAALEKMNDEDMFSNPELIQSEAASKRFNRQVEAMKSKTVASGMVNRIGEVDGKTFDGTGNGFTDNTLAYSLYNAADDVERYAITSQLMASGHHGAEALHQVMTALGNDGNTAALATIAAAAKGDSKLGDLKSGARSTYDYINDLAEGKIKAGAVGTGGNISDYVTGAHDADHEGRQVNFGGMSEQQLVNTDKEELRRYEQVIAQKRARGEELNDNEKKLVAQATAAWNNERIRGSAKKDIQDTISRIAFGEVKTPGVKGGDKKGNAIENEIVDIRGGESEPGPIPTQTPAGGESGTEPVSSGSTGGGPSATGSGGGSTISYDDSAQEAFANAQQAVNEDRIARERAAREEARRAEMKSYDMDEATYEMMNAQQGVEQEKANRSANRETARSSRFNRRGPNPYNSESGNKS